jgi:glycosyltransferase involved in cell wall biosynthesis
MQYFTKRFNFPSYKLDVLYNSSNFFNIKKFSQKKSKKIIIGYIGRFVELKRIKYLIELREFLNNKGLQKWKIELIGDGPDREKLEQFVKKKKLGNHIKFHGFQADLLQFYGSFDIFINPSREECLSIALIDSGINSVPSIAFNTGGNNEIIQENISGFIVRTKKEMFEKTLLLINNFELREKFGRRARKYCMEMFSSQRHLSKLEAIYKQCIIQK